jgi:hypothetical protein
MPRTSAILRQSEHHADGRAPSVASAQRQGRTGAANEEPQFPLSVSPPLSIASSAPADPISGSGLSLRVHSDLDEVREQWKAFEQQADRTVFQSFDWLAAWQRHIGARRGTVPAIVLGRDADGQLLFILQLAIETHGLTRRLTWLGSQLCDYNAPLLAEQFSGRMSAERFGLAWQDVIKLLRANPRWQFDMIDLQKLPEAVGAQRNPFLDLRVLAHPSGAYVANLRRTWDEFYAAKRSSSTREKEGRQLKHLAEHGEVRFVDVTDKDDLTRTLETLFDQNSRAFGRRRPVRPTRPPRFLPRDCDRSGDARGRPCQPARRRRHRGRGQCRAQVPRLLSSHPLELRRRAVAIRSRTCPPA